MDGFVASIRRELKAKATRSINGEVLNIIAAIVVELIGGAADLKV